MYENEWAEFNKRIDANPGQRTTPARYGSLREDGSVYVNEYGGCCSQIGKLSEGGKKKAVVLFSSYQAQNEGYKEFTEADHHMWIDYYVNRSPWAPVHILKDPKKIYRKAYIFNPDNPRSLVGSCFIINRFSTEQAPTSFKVWINMVKHGVNEDIALFLSHMYAYTSKDVIQYAPYNRHNSFHPDYMGRKAMKNFIKRKLEDRPEEGTFADQPGYGQLYSIWGKCDEKERLDNQMWFKNLKPRLTKTTIDFQIFKSPKQNPNIAMGDDKATFTNIAEQFKEWLYA